MCYPACALMPHQLCIWVSAGRTQAQPYTSYPTQLQHTSKLQQLCPSHITTALYDAIEHTISFPRANNVDGVHARPDYDSAHIRSDRSRPSPSAAHLYL
jgi:hypothetical protein